MNSRQASDPAKASEGLFSNAQLKALLKAGHAKGVRFRLQVTGFSMSPFIRSGDVVTVAMRAGIRFGDVVAFIHPHTDRVLIHRVVGLTAGHAVTRGDNTHCSDGRIPCDRILGRVEQIENNGYRQRWGLGLERIIIAFLTRTGMMLSIGLPLWKMVKRIM